MMVVVVGVEVGIGVGNPTQKGRGCTSSRLGVKITDFGLT